MWTSPGFPDTRRLKKVTISAEKVVLFCAVARFALQGPHVLSVNPLKLPHDARIVAVAWEHEYQAFGVIVASESFEEVPAGERIPHSNEFYGKPVSVVVNEYRPDYEKSRNG